MEFEGLGLDRALSEALSLKRRQLGLLLLSSGEVQAQRMFVVASLAGDRLEYAHRSFELISASSTCQTLLHKFNAELLRGS